MQKKGQTLVVSVVVILVILILFIQLFISEFFKANSKEDPKLSDYTEEAQRISSILASNGIPFNWVADDVLRPGLLREGYLANPTLDEYSKIDYGKSKKLFGTSNEYIFFLKNNTNILKVNNREYWGYPLDAADINGGEKLEDIMTLISSSRSLGKSENFIMYKPNEDSGTGTLSLIVYSWQP